MLNLVHRPGRGVPRCAGPLSQAGPGRRRRGTQGSRRPTGRGRCRSPRTGTRWPARRAAGCARWPGRTRRPDSAAEWSGRPPSPPTTALTRPGAARNETWCRGPACPRTRRTRRRHPPVPGRRARRGHRALAVLGALQAAGTARAARRGAAGARKARNRRLARVNTTVPQAEEDGGSHRKIYCALRSRLFHSNHSHRRWMGAPGSPKRTWAENDGAQPHDRFTLFPARAVE